MSEIKAEKEVLLFIGIIYDEKIVSKIFELEKKLEDMFGKIFLKTESFNFDYTTYYNLEMGDILKKKFYAFENLILESKLAEIKVSTNDIEKQFSENNCRKINLDPGFVDLAKVVLASAKDFSHRIYIGKGIFAEITLMYSNSKKDKKLISENVEIEKYSLNYKFLPWTYPDFKSENYLKFFEEARIFYKNKIKAKIKK
jgi:hypothetical protein